MSQKIQFEIDASKVHLLLNNKGETSVVYHIGKTCHVRISIDRKVNHRQQTVTVVGQDVERAQEMIERFTSYKNVWCDAPPGTLYMDGSLLIPYCFPLNKTWDLQIAQLKLQDLVASVPDETEIVVFFDMRPSVFGDYPPLATTLLSEMLTQLDVQNFFCHDLTPTLVYYATHDVCGHIVARDKDLFRFQGGPIIQVYGDFAVHRRVSLILSPHRIHTLLDCLPDMTPCLSLPNIVPSLELAKPFLTGDHYWGDSHRGEENPMATMRPLRQALYKQWGKEKIIEHLPAESIVFAPHGEEVFDHLLQCPDWRAAYHYLFPGQKGNTKYTVSCQWCVLQVWCQARGKKMVDELV